MDAIKPRKTLSEQTHDILFNAICSGEFEPGQRLNQDEIAARLQVSRQPVNSALSVLKASGFVEDTGRRGVVVSQISVDQFLSIFELRSALEPFAIRLAHHRKPADAAKQAQDVLKRGWNAVASKDVGLQIDLDYEFHEMIYDWAGNPAIRDTMRTNWNHIRRAMGVVLRRGVASKTSCEEHDRIIAALMRSDVEQAEDEMRQHIERAQEKTAALLSEC